MIIDKDNKFTWQGFLLSFILGIGIGAVPYTLTKLFKLEGAIWFIPFFFLPPIIGAVIYALCNKK